MNYQKFFFVTVLVIVLIFLVTGSADVQATELGEASIPTNSLEDVILSLRSAIVWVEADLGNNQHSQGSGFIVDEAGYVITTAHVIDGYREVCVGWPPDQYNPSVVAAEVIAVNRDLDLAILDLEGSGYPALEIGYDVRSEVSIGHSIIVLGFPVGSMIGLNDITVTKGIVSSFVCIENNLIMEIDATVSLGSSGGPLYSLDNHTVIGIIYGMGLEVLTGFNFAIPIEGIFEWSGTSPKLGVSHAVRQLYIKNQMVNLLQS